MRMLDQSHIENIEWNKVNSIKFADATKNIPMDNRSVDCVYTSHMFEHLSRLGAKKFLKEVLRVLKIGGVLRISVPDLKFYVDEYLCNKDADMFMHNMFIEAPPINNLKEKIILLIYGYRHHQWMYDQNSLCKLLEEFDFKDIQVCTDGYSRISEPEGLNLYERADNSIFVEAIK